MWSRQTRYKSLILAVLGACASSQTSPDAPGAAPEQPLVIYREASYPDAELAAAQLGRIEIAVRSADRPTQALPNTFATLQPPDSTRLRRGTADSTGVIRMDSLRVGTHTLRVLRIGYSPATVRVPVTAGCRTDVEVYIGVQSIGIAPPPSMQGRSVITTCQQETDSR